MIALMRFEDVARAIEWSVWDAVSIAILVFGDGGYETSHLEESLPEGRENYVLSLTNRAYIASRLTPEMAIELMTDVNAHTEAAAFQQVLGGNG